MRRRLMICLFVSVSGLLSAPALADEPLPPGARARLGTARYNAPLASASVSPDGAHLLTVDVRDVVRVWDTRHEFLVLQREGLVTGHVQADFIDATRVLAVGDEGGYVLGLDGGEARRLEGPWCDASAPCALKAARASGEVAVTLAAGGATGGVLRAWSLRDGRMLADHALEGAPWTLTLSPDGAHALAAFDGGRQRRLLTLAAPQALRDPGCGAAPLSASVFSADGARLALILQEEMERYSVCLVALGAGDAAPKIAAFEDPEGRSVRLLTAGFTADGDQVHVYSERGWPGRETEFFIEGYQAEHVAAATGEVAESNNELLAPHRLLQVRGEGYLRPTFDDERGVVKLINVFNGEVARQIPSERWQATRHTGPIVAMASSANAGRLITRDHDGRTLAWDVAAAQVTHHPALGPLLAVSADGARVYDGAPASLQEESEHGCGSEAHPGSIGVTDLGAGVRRALVQGEHLDVQTLALAPDGQSLVFCHHVHANPMTICGMASGRITARVERVGLADGEREQLYERVDALCGVQGGAMSADASRVLIYPAQSSSDAAEGLERSVALAEVVEVSSGRSVYALGASDWGAALSPDGRVLAYVDGAGEALRLVRVDDGAQLAEVKLGHKRVYGQALGLAFSPDATTLVFGDGPTLRALDVASPGEAVTLHEGDETLLMVHFSADGAVLFSAAGGLWGRGGGSALAWDAAGLPR